MSRTWEFLANGGNCPQCHLPPEQKDSFVPQVAWFSVAPLTSSHQECPHSSPRIHEASSAVSICVCDASIAAIFRPWTFMLSLLDGVEHRNIWSILCTDDPEALLLRLYYAPPPQPSFPVSMFCLELIWGC